MSGRFVFPLFPRMLRHSMWGELGHHNLYSMERTKRAMDRQVGNMFDSFFQAMPRSIRSLEEDQSTEEVKNSVVIDKNGNRQLRLQFDVRQFKPEEITVRSYDEGKVEVSAKHESKDEKHRIYREYCRVITLPDGVTPESLKSQFFPDGVLNIEAPMPAIENQNTAEQPKMTEPIAIEIQHEKKPE